MGFVLSARIFVMRRGQAQGPLIPTSHPPVPTDDGALPRQFCIRLLIFIGEGISIAIRPTSHTNALIWLCVIASLYSYCNEGHDISATEQAQAWLAFRVKAVADQFVDEPGGQEVGARLALHRT